MVSIVGPGRSGSTLVSNILGEMPGVLSPGELRWVWRRDIPQGRICGCGLPPSSCSLWSKAVPLAMGLPGHQWDDAAVRSRSADIAAAQTRVTRLRSRARLLRTSRTQRSAPDEATLAAATTSLIDALVEVTGCAVVVDASKRPQEAALIAGSERYEHYVLHVVRDPRATVSSWQREKPLPAATGRRAMPPRRLTKSVWRWVESCTGAEYLRRHVDPDRWMFVRYEDFALAPRDTLTRIVQQIGVDVALPFVDQDTVTLGANHVLSGNPDRFRTGPVHITQDVGWKRRMPPRDQAAVATMTLPFLLRYGYPVRPQHEEADDGAA